MAEVQCSVVVVDLGREEADACCELCSAVDILIASACEADAVGRGGAFVEERAVMGPKLGYV